MRLVLSNTMSRSHRLLLVAAALYIGASLVVGVALSEFTLRVHRRPMTQRAQFADVLQQQFHADLKDVTLRAEDSAVLRGWFASPRSDNGATVILLHGVTDNRRVWRATRDSSSNMDIVYSCLTLELMEKAVAKSPRMDF